jgi:dihydroorotase
MLSPATYDLPDVWYLAPDGMFRSGTVSVADGRIASVRPAGPPLPRPPPDAAWWAPAGIDPHVHFREPGAAAAEGVANGSRAARAGGVAWVCDMPNNLPPVLTAEDLRAKAALFRRDCSVHYALFLDARGDAPLEPPACGWKLFLTDVACNRAAVAPLLRGRKRVTVHAEDAARFRSDPALPHHLRRPVRAVGSALGALEDAYFSLPERERPVLVLAHATGRKEMEFARRMRRKGARLFVETAPHYLLFTARDQCAAGPQLKVNPPLRAGGDRVALWRALQGGDIDFLGSDHAPHTPEAKASDAPPSGMPGVEWFLPIAYTFAAAGFLPFRRVMELTSFAARRAYGLPESGGIAAGSPADLARMVPAAYASLPAARVPWHLRASPGTPARPVVSRAGYNPYRDFPFAWFVDDIRLS